MSTETLERVDPSQFATRRDAIESLDAAARAVSGHDALGDAIWRDLEAPNADSVGFLIDGRAYVHVTRDKARWIAGTIRLPDARDGATTATLLAAAVEHARTHGGGRLECWVFGADDADDLSFRAAGFTTTRELFEMRVALPLDEAPAWPAGVTVRAFERGRDEADWLRVNNVAFEGHPDQGSWTMATLEHRIAQPWFDPELFLLAIDHDGLTGFNWLKLHEARPPDPELGEIYVIGVDPRAQGTGLGRALAIAGLRAVHERGVGIGMLFVAADNPGALALYRSLGFEVHRTDRAYTVEVDSA
ncbi:MAG: mycothiol synthase [Actinomycetota bacterium]|nr:mycothiol synthase [Actinomycetota bacterium]